jgi:hypothetical protein
VSVFWPRRGARGGADARADDSSVGDIERASNQTVTGDWKFQAIDPASIRGTVDMTISTAAHTVTINGKFRGKWIRSSCAAAMQLAPLFMAYLARA